MLSVHNNEIDGLKYAISKGVDINVKNGMLLNTGVLTVVNTKKVEILRWLLVNGADTQFLTKDSMELIDRYGTQELKEMIKNATQ
jgi:hypothetical protein